MTEVHHVNGEGEDAGIVYCEMQSSENSQESLLYRAFMTEMYPGHCGYKVALDSYKLLLVFFKLF